MNDDPRTRDGSVCWGERWRDVEVRFLGRGPWRDLSALVRAAEPTPPRRLAWLSQVHSTRTLRATAGHCGEGDALWTDRTDLAVSVATADCVPILIAGADRVLAIHAGWRGIARGVVASALHALERDPAALRAWIGPAIGPCCYEVGNEVAEQVARASAPWVVLDRQPRPHLDLPAAVEAQLRAAGLRHLIRLTSCTRCDGERWWSYRRDGSAAGRNLALIWIQPETVPTN